MKNTYYYILIIFFFFQCEFYFQPEKSIKKVFYTDNANFDIVAKHIYFTYVRSNQFKLKNEIYFSQTNPEIGIYQYQINQQIYDSLVSKFLDIHSEIKYISFDNYYINFDFEETKNTILRYSYHRQDTLNHNINGTKIIYLQDKWEIFIDEF